MRHLYLHVGPHKTGTTSIQGSLFAARAGLTAQGILYPDSIPGARYVKSHNDVATRVDRKEYQSVEDYVLGLAGAPPSIHSVILSGEEFSKLFATDAFDWIAELLGRHFMLSIIYVQRQPETLLASLAVNWATTIPDHILNKYTGLDDFVSQMVEFNERREAFFHDRDAMFVPYEELPTSTFVASFFLRIFGFELEGLSEDQLNTSEAHSLDETLVGPLGAPILEFFEIEDRFPLEGCEGEEAVSPLPGLVRRAIQEQTRARTREHLRGRRGVPSGPDG